MLSQRIERELRNRIIPFWRSLRDQASGGYCGYVSFDGQRDWQADKATLLTARTLWFFASAAKQLSDPSLLAEAAHAYDFLSRHSFDRTNGGVWWSVAADGAPRDTSKQTYCQAFAIYALAAYYDASGDEAALTDARDLFEVIETRCFDGDGYGEAFDQQFDPIENEKLSENGVIADRTMNTLLHVFEAYAGLYEVAPSDKLEATMRRILEIFTTQVFNPAEKRLDVFFDKQMQSLLDMQSFGHDIEAAWLLGWGTATLSDATLTRQIEQISTVLAASVYDRGLDNGAIMYERDGDHFDTNRHWWVQVEAMLGFAHAWQLDPTGPRADDYRSIIGQLWDYIERFVVDQRPGGEWYWAIDRIGQPVPDLPLAGTWKCPYHSGRACLRLAKALPLIEPAI